MELPVGSGEVEWVEPETEVGTKLTPTTGFLVLESGIMVEGSEGGRVSPA